MAKLIYLADDMAPIRLLLQATLKSAGYVAHSFASGNGLLAYVAKVTPDLVITDLVMPEGDGYDVLAALAGTVPVIVLSGPQPVGGWSMTGHMLDMADLHGAVAVVQKSADLRPLLAAVAEALA